MDRTIVVRRTTTRLIAAHCCSQLGLAVLLIVAVPAAAAITGHEWVSGLVFAVSLGSGAVASFVIGRWMDRVGRMPGLRLAYSALAVGSATLAWAIGTGSIGGLLLGSAMFGAGTGSANLVRGAVADMHPPERRGRALGLLVAAGVVGAVGGPLVFVPLLRAISDARGVDPDVAAWTIPLVGALVALAFVATIRRDPRDLSAETPSEETARAARGPRELLRVPAFAGAVIAAAVAQAAMIGVMGVTPTELTHLGHRNDVSWVISLHVAGMFAFAPIVGVVLDRWGRRTGLLLGLGLSAAGALVAASQGAVEGVGAGLFVIGLGWSGTYLGVTAVISDVTAANERTGALGFSDLLVQITSATAALVSGVLLEAAGYRSLAQLAAGFLIAAGVTVSWIQRRPEPARA